MSDTSDAARKLWPDEQPQDQPKKRAARTPRAAAKKTAVEPVAPDEINPAPTDVKETT